MKRLAWVLAVLSFLGCGGSGPTGSAFSESPELTRMSAALRLSGRDHIVAFGIDEIIVPAVVFGTTTDVIAHFAFLVVKNGRGDVRGLYRVSESVDGLTSNFAGHLSCLGVYDFNGITGNRAKVGGRIDSSDDPGIPVGTFIWWQAIDNRKVTGDKPDQSTLPGFGTEQQNLDFCASSNPPRFGPFDVVRGDIAVLTED